MKYMKRNEKEIKENIKEQAPHFKITSQQEEKLAELIIKTNNQIRECIKEKEKIYNHLCKILNNITNKKRVSANKHITIRENQIYKYNSNKRATIKDLINNEKTINQIKQNITNKTLKRKFTKIINKLKNTKNQNIHITKNYIKDHYKAKAFYIKNIKTKKEFKNNTIYTYRLRYLGEEFGRHNRLETKKQAKEKIQDKKHVLTENLSISKGLNTGEKRRIIKNYQQYKKLIKQTQKTFKKQTKKYNKILTKILKKFKKELTIINLQN